MSLEAPSAGSGSTVSDIGRLIREHQAGVWRYLRVLGCDAAQAEDLTQETFLAVLQRPFVEISRPATAAYLRTTARNLLISARRRSARYQFVDDIDKIDIDQIERDWEQFAGDSGGDEAIDALRRCLEHLSDRARMALELRFRDRKSRSEIAAALGIGEHGAKNLMQRAKKQLLDCVQRKLK